MKHHQNRFYIFNFISLVGVEDIINIFKISIAPISYFPGTKFKVNIFLATPPFTFMPELFQKN
jgi:hypothetical protein